MDSFDVVVLGGGPLGLFAAHLLSSHGITVIVLGTPEPDQTPPAVHFNSDILRLMRSASNKLSSRVLQHVQLVPEVSCGDGVPGTPKETEGKTKKEGKLLRDYIRIFEEEFMTQFTPTHTFHQPTFENYMRDLLENEYDPDEAQSLVGCTITHVTTDSDGKYTIQYQHEEEDCECMASYILGCDGAKSFTRNYIKADFLGSSWQDQPWLVLDCKANNSREVTAAPTTTMVLDASRPFICIPLPDARWRFEFAVREGESKSKIKQPEALEQLMREQGLRPEEFIIENSMVYSYEAQIASHWRKDNIFLLGDAAHYQPGITGSGLCHSMRDALNLCWKLAYVVKEKASASLLETYEEERHAVTRESVAKSIENSKEHKSRSFKALCHKVFWYLLRLTMGDLWTMRARHRRQINSGLPYVSGGFTIPSLDDKATTAGKMMISPKLRVIYAEPWAHSGLHNNSMEIARKGPSSSQKQEIAFLDAFVSWRDMTIIWMTRSALEPSAHATLSEKDQSFLTELGATVLHVRLTTDVSNSKVKGADATLKDDAGRFTEWATTAFHEKKEVLVLRPDLVIFGVYTHKDAFNIVPDLEDMLWFTGS